MNRFRVVFPCLIAISRCQNCGTWQDVNKSWACKCENPGECKTFESITEAQEFITASGWQWGDRELQPFIDSAV